MKFVETNLKGVYVIEPAIYEDDRGHFLEAFREKVFQDRGVIFRYVQDNISTSVRGVVRGLHYQKEPFTQAKLVMAVKGEILDVAVDIRKDRSEEHTSELQSRGHHVCRPLLEVKELL